MGRDRNEYGANAKKGTSFKGETICKFFLLDFCPHDLFPNTRVDLGPCDREHRADLKVAFETDPEREFYQALFETEFARYLQRLVDQMENRIKRVQQRIDANNQPVELSKENEERVNSMNAEISELLKQQDEAGSKGDIDAAEKLNEKVAFLQREVSRLKNPNADIATIRESQLRVCATCGAMQSTGDAMCRFESHVSGKQHRGCERIRSKLAALKETEAEREEVLKKYQGKQAEVAAANTLSLKREAGQRDRELQADRERERDREERGSGPPRYRRSREGGHGGPPSEYASSRDRRRERERDRYYSSRDREREYRDRDYRAHRDREYSGRDRDRYRSGERDRERERSRYSTSYRSRDRSRDRSREPIYRSNGYQREDSHREGGSTPAKGSDSRGDPRNALKSFVHAGQSGSGRMPDHE
ncbi:hypothetical protein cyc_07194 [Cyclospora cayetanensis]|nr:hypothetical protein cyc_07194 [Cyclospora cayetanensis]